MSHLTSEQRYTIEVMCKEGYGKVAIAKAINRDKSVVYRELNHNCDKRPGLYHHALAQRKYKKRQQE